MATDYYTSTTQMPSWVQPYAQGYLQRAQATADMPYQQFQGQRVAEMDPIQARGYAMQAQRGMQGSPLMQQAGQQLQNTIGGGFLNGNPYLQSQIDQAQGDLVKQWNTVQAPQFDTAMNRSGSFGNSGIAQRASMGADSLQRNIGQISSDMRFRNYANERGMQMQALGMAPGFAQNDYLDAQAVQNAGQAFQQQNQRQLDDAYGRFVESRDYPQQQLNIMRNALGGVNFGSQQTQSAPGTSTGASLVGGVLTGAQLWKMLFGD